MLREKCGRRIQNTILVRDHHRYAARPQSRGNTAVKVRTATLPGLTGVQKNQPEPTAAKDLLGRTVVHRVRVALIVLKDEEPLVQGGVVLAVPDEVDHGKISGGN